jgi:chorismate mutase
MCKVIAVRGATTLTKDEPEELDLKVKELVSEILTRNSIKKEQIISAIVTATVDIKCKYPATAARLGGLDDVPIIGAQEVDAKNGLPLCVRVMLHVQLDEEHAALDAVYLHEAKKLRPDLNLS